MGSAARDVIPVTFLAAVLTWAGCIPFGSLSLSLFGNGAFEAPAGVLGGLRGGPPPQDGNPFCCIVPHFQDERRKGREGC